VLILASVAALAGCGGRQNLLLPPDEGTGTIDFSEAPATLPMTCDHGVGAVALDDPCLVGFNVASTDPTSVGVHEVECTLATPTHPLAWGFIISLANLSASPGATLSFPGDVPMPPTSRPQVSIGSRRASVMGIAGKLAFSTVDAAHRAFVAHLEGTITWTASDGSTFSCAVDAPLWGAPGSFE